jgi:protein O-GlcNAc transferase
MTAVLPCKKAYDPPVDVFHGIESELSAEGLFRLALWFQSNGDVDHAIVYYGKALRAAPNMMEALYNIGILHYQQKSWPEAIAHFKAALELKPGSVNAAFNLAAALKEKGEFVNAAEAYHTTLQIDPEMHLAHYYQALCLQNAGMHLEATRAFLHAIALDPNNALYWFHMATSVLRTDAIDQVLTCYQRAVQLKPGWDKAHYNLAVALRLKERLPEAIAHMQRALEINANFHEALAYIFRLAQHACDWPLVAKTAEQLDVLTSQQLADGQKTAEFPLINLRRQADPARNMMIACSWSRSIAKQVNQSQNQPTFEHSARPCRRLRIGYLSNDFKNHAVAHQIRGMLACHDRKHFEVFGYAGNKNDGTRYRGLLGQACDHFRDIHNLSPEAAAKQIHADGIHILVEMSGHSKNSLLPIAALRPAPLQISYLGFLGTTGADFIDYILADRWVVPQTQFPYFTEKVIHLPHCYQANDDQQHIAACRYSRSQFNLPEDAFVFCSFNQPYKIDAPLFGRWLNILKKTSKSVLWLVQRNALAQKNLLQAAQTAGVDSARLIFTGFMPLEQNLARLQLADLVLDTLTYNGGATTSNALWAGVPVITVAGSHWVSRMTSSALRAIGMPELIAPNVKAYERLAVDLATHPDQMKTLRRKLSIRRRKAPLFNTRLFTRHVELAFKFIWKRYMAGQSPQSFAVTPLHSSNQLDGMCPDNRPLAHDCVQQPK